MVARPTRRGAPLAHQHAPANAHEYARHAEHKHAHTHTGECAHADANTHSDIHTEMRTQARTHRVTVCSPTVHQSSMTEGPVPCIHHQQKQGHLLVLTTSLFTVCSCEGL